LIFTGVGVAGKFRILIEGSSYYPISYNLTAAADTDFKITKQNG
jgi:hypothetical protein